MIKKYLFILFLMFGNLFSMQTDNLTFNATDYIEKHLRRYGWDGIRRKLRKTLYASQFKRLIFNRPKTIFDSHIGKFENTKKQKFTSDDIKRIASHIKRLKALNMKIINKKQYDSCASNINFKNITINGLSAPSWNGYVSHLLSKIKKFEKKKNEKANHILRDLKDLCNEILTKINDPNELFPIDIDPFSIIEADTFKSLKKLKIIHLQDWEIGKDYRLLNDVCNCCSHLKTIYITRQNFWKDSECKALMVGFMAGNISLQIKDAELKKELEERPKTD